MSIILAANNAGTTLAGSLSPTATTVALAVGTGVLFPQPTTGQYYVATLIPASSTTGLPNEIVWVTAMSGDTATIVRAREGTTALSFNTGDLFQNLWTAGSFATLVQSGQLQAQSTNWAVDTGTANAISISLSPALTSLSAVIGIPIRIKKGGSANTDTTTLTVNGLGPIPILTNGGLTAMWAGSLPANNVLEVVYDGTQWELISNFAPPPNSIINSKLAQMASNTVKANATGVTANPTDVGIAALIAAGLSGTLSASGYISFPIGSNTFTLNWGKYNSAITQGSYPVTFNQTFPTAVVGLWATAINTLPDGNKDIWMQVVSTNLSGATFFAQNSYNSTNAADGFYWCAIGY